MNEERRKRLSQAITMLDSANNLITEVKDEEQEAFDNMPEGFQQGDKGEKMNAAIEALDEAINNLESAVSWSLRGGLLHAAIDIIQMLDISEPASVEVVISADRKTLWINVDGICRLRAYRVQNMYTDNRDPIGSQ